jgi:site-specific recombinase XerC
MDPSAVPAGGLMKTAIVLRPSKPELPALIAATGKRAASRFLEFFTVNIRNRNTRAAYARAARAFLAWCEARGLNRLQDVEPIHVAAYIEALQAARSAPTVKQHLACIRMLFDWLVTGQVIPSNPGAFRARPAALGQQGRLPRCSPPSEATATCSSRYGRLQRWSACATAPSSPP